MRPAPCLLPFLALVIGALATDGATAAWPRAQGEVPMISMGVQAYLVSDDDGGRKTHITPAQVTSWVDKANEIYSSINVHFNFDESAGSDDWQEIQNTLINSMSGVDHPDWIAQRNAANGLAANTPDKMVVYFRWGPNQGSPTGGGFSWTDYDFIAMPGFYDTGVCGQQNIGILAHEAGHYLGLAHTFSPTFGTIAEAENYFISHGHDPAVFEGDGRDDTPPDPFTGQTQCFPPAFINLDGVTLPLPRRNIMSYYYPVSEISDSQAWTLRTTLLLRSGQSLTNLLPGPAQAPQEGEDFNYSVTAGNSADQGMGGFLGKWSGDAQAFWIDGDPGDQLSFNFNAPADGQYEVYAAFTAANDYGIFEHSINGQTAPPVDLYSQIVLPTGPIALGVFDLSAGSNQWVAEITGRNPDAYDRYGYGLDYLMLIPIPGPGDMNGDGLVNLDDLNPFVEALTDRAAYDLHDYGVDADLLGDVNGDGAFNLGDVGAFRALLASASSGAAESVPEPTALLMSIVAAGLTLIGRRGKRGRLLRLTPEPLLA